jgi:teichuronic acid exporter
LIVGKTLGLQAFGIYSFGSNTGSGIATGLATALGQAVLPFLSDGREQSDLRARFRLSIAAMSFVIMPIVMLQVALAPWYVPIVFGEKWAPAIPTLMLMCLGTLSRPLIVATSQLLRATGAVGLEWRISQINAILFVVAIIGGIPFGVEGVAACLSAVNILPAIIFARVALSSVAEDKQRAPTRAFAEAGA